MNTDMNPLADESCNHSGYLAPYVAAHTEKNGALLQQEAIRTRSYSARNLLAIVATGGIHPYWPLANLLEEGRGQSCIVRELISGRLDAKAVLALARVVSAQRLFSSDAYIAKALYDVVYMSSPTDFTVADWINFIGIHTSAGEIERASRILAESSLDQTEPYEHACLLANITAAAGTADNVNAAQLGALNALFQLDGLEPINFLERDAPPLDRIQCELTGNGSEGPLVTVLMTNYCVGEAVRTAVRSVLNQSWRNLELVIVDDCSPEDEFRRLLEVQRTDSRVRVLRTSSNSGTYTARNVGLSEANGEFVTCHDSDDWSHPRKIERQVGHLLSTGSVANLSQWARTSDDLRFQRFSATGKYIYPNSSSLMFRREPVLARLGGWDPVRSGADTEFYKRIELTFGQKLSVLPGAPLSFARVRATALTSGTLGLGWSSPARRQYRAAWAHWHREIKAGLAEPFLDPTRGRPFPAPVTNLPTQSSVTYACEDSPRVVIAADLRDKQLGPLVAAEVRALSSARVSVALCHIPSMGVRVAGRELPDRSFQSLINDGSASRVELEDNSECELLIVRDPSVLQFSGKVSCGIKPRNILIATETLPSDDAGASQGYVVSLVDAAAFEMFGVPAYWSSTNLLLRSRVSELLGSGALLDPPLPQSPAAWPENAPPVTRRSDAPTIGFCFPDSTSRWDDWGILDERLFPSKGLKVRISGGRIPKHVEHAPPPEWDVVCHRAMEAATFFSGVHFVPYFPPATEKPHVSATLVAAMSAGCIILAPPSFRELLGDGALYVDKDSVKPLIAWYAADAQQMLAQASQAQEHARGRFSPEAYTTHIQRLINA